MDAGLLVVLSLIGWIVYVLIELYRSEPDSNSPTRKTKNPLQ